MNRRALCVGISRYDDDSFDNLPQCKLDAELLSKLLSSNGGGYSTRTELDLTASELKEVIWDFLESSGNEDELLLFFSGHGKRTYTRKLCLAARDTVDKRFLPTSVKFDEVLEYLRELDKKSVLIILDCCFSGSAEESILSKSGVDVIDEEAKELLAEKGWSVLTSSGRFAASWASKDKKLSDFTAALLQVSEDLIGQNSGWIKVASVYENLKYQPLRETPKLMGNNALFRILKGAADEKTIEGPIYSHFSEISFRPCDSTQIQILGLLVLDGFRAWAATLPDDIQLAGTEQILGDVHILVNRDEVFSRKIDDAKTAILKAREALSALVKQVGRPILLAYPISLPEVTFLRFQGSDRKYVLTSRKKLKPQAYVEISERDIFALSTIDSDWHVFQLPEDYAREAFGFSVEPRASKDNQLIVIKEDTFRRNSKYIAVTKNTNAIAGLSTIGKSGESNFTGVSDADTVRERLEKSIVARQSKFQGIGGAIMVETESQTALRESETPVHCDVCMDEKEVLAEINTRKYRVPCPSCNAEQNGTWRSFFSEHRSDESAKPRLGLIDWFKIGRK